MNFIYTAPRYHTNQHFLAKALLKKGHTVSFIVLTQGQSEEYSVLKPTVLGYSIIYDMFLRLLERLAKKKLILASWGSRKGGLPPIVKFFKEMKNKKPDVVIVRDPFTAYGLASMVISKIIFANIIFYVQRPKYGHLGWKQRIVYNFASWALSAKWVTPVLGSSKKYKSFHSKVQYVPFVMEPRINPENKKYFKNGKVNILSVGKFQSRKNHALFLNAMAVLSKKYPIRATIVGECSTLKHKKEFNDVVSLSHSLGISDDISLFVNVSFSEVQKFYEMSDIFVLTSRCEPAAISPLEAMAHSLPAICSDSNGTKCYISHGKNGFVFKTDDLDNLVECMEDLLQNRHKILMMGKYGYDLVVSRHAPIKYVDVIESIGRRNVRKHE